MKIEIEKVYGVPDNEKDPMDAAFIQELENENKLLQKTLQKMEAERADLLNQIESLKRDSKIQLNIDLITLRAERDLYEKLYADIQKTAFGRYN